MIFLFDAVAVDACVHAIPRTNLWRGGLTKRIPAMLGG